MRWLLLMAICISAGCKTRTEKHVSSRGAEQSRLENLDKFDTEKSYNMHSGSFRGAGAYSGAKSAHTKEFQYVDRTRTKDFNTRGYTTKGSWMGNFVYGTKEAPTKQHWWSGKTSSTKTYATRETHDANRVAPTRDLPGGNRTYAVKGRRQGEFDSDGPASKIPVQSWEGELKPLTMDDVKTLLNKN